MRLKIGAALLAALLVVGAVPALAHGPQSDDDPHTTSTAHPATLETGTATAPDGEDYDYRCLTTPGRYRDGAPTTITINGVKVSYTPSYWVPGERTCHYWIPPRPHQLRANWDAKGTGIWQEAEVTRRRGAGGVWIYEATPVGS